MGWAVGGWLACSDLPSSVPAALLTEQSFTTAYLPVWTGSLGEGGALWHPVGPEPRPPASQASLAGGDNSLSSLPRHWSLKQEQEHSCVAASGIPN